MPNTAAVHPSQSPGPRYRIPGTALWRFRRDPLTFLTDLARDYGDVAHFTLLGRDTFLLAHPEHIRRVLVEDAHRFVKGLGLQRMRRVLGQGLLTQEGPAHRRDRRQIQPDFDHRRMVGYAEIMWQEAVSLAESWRPGQVVEVAREMNRLTLLVVGKALFRTDLSAQAETIGQALDALIQVTEPLWLTFGPWLERTPLPSARRYRWARAVLEQVVQTLIQDHRQRGPAPDGGDVLDHLLAAMDAGQMDPRTVHDHTLVLLLAGHETTANALAWTWWLLAHHPEAEARLREEARNLEQDPPENAWKRVTRLTYTRMVLQEAMRLYPPAWVIGRSPLEDYLLDGHMLPAGSSVLMSQWVTHRDPRWYPEPERFLPERWSAEARSGRPKFAYFPFGGGPRVCIGAHFAQTEAVLALAAIGARWRLRPLVDRVQPQARVTLRPRGGMPMQVMALDR